MNDERPAGQGASQVVVKEGKKFSIVWIVPVVAVLVAGGLGVRSYLQKGPVVTITFETADGLEEGKTKVMYRSVQVGLVEGVELSKDKKGVIVTAELHPGAKPYLNEGSEWWVVRPRIGAGGISGLGTLISGAYIEFDGGSGAPTKTFKGLEVPPLTRVGEEGRKFVLKAAQLGSLNYGSPIYYHQIEVGEVTGFRLAEEGVGVDIDVFIKDPHHRRVKESSRFWNASGVEVSMGADGFSVRTASLEALIAGGIAFDTLNHKTAGEVADGHVFELFDTFEKSQEKAPEKTFNYVLYFEGSVRGLSKGAPVDFRGIQVGEVTEVKLEYDKATQEVRIPVVIELVPQNLTDRDPSEVVATMVEHGMRAQLQMGNILTGQLFIELEMHPEVPAKFVAGKDSPYPELPTIPASIEAILEDVSAIVKKIDDLPFGKVIDDVSTMLESANKLVNKVDAKVDPLVSNVDKSLADLQKVLESAQRLISADSPLMFDVTTLLEELAAASRSVRVLSSYLERHPEALIYGKGGSAAK